jgi:hypothetical protein
LFQTDSRRRVVFDDQHALGGNLWISFDNFRSASGNHQSSALNHVIFTFWPPGAADAS